MTPLDVGRTTIGGTQCTVETIERRNWSTVARAHSQAGSALFLKQFRDAVGNWREADLDHEIDGAQTLADLGLSSVDVAVPVIVDRSNLTVAYSWQEIDTIDLLARSHPGSIGKASHQLAATVEQLLAELTAAAPAVEAKRRQRSWEPAAITVCPKGLDLRNLGWSPDRPRPLLFDSGPVQLASIEEAAAKLVCSALLLNFGHPVSRTLRGVDNELADTLVGGLRSKTHRVAIDHELARLRRHRSQEPKAHSMRERLTIRPATAVLDRWYRRSIDAWVDDNISSGDSQTPSTHQDPTTRQIEMTHQDSRTTT